MPRTEGPNEPARPKHTHRSTYPYLIALRFPLINRFRSLSLRRLRDGICTTHPRFAPLYALVLDHRLFFGLAEIPTHSLYVPVEQPHAPAINVPLFRLNKPHDYPSFQSTLFLPNTISSDLTTAPTPASWGQRMVLSDAGVPCGGWQGSGYFLYT